MSRRRVQERTRAPSRHACIVKTRGECASARVAPAASEFILLGAARANLAVFAFFHRNPGRVWRCGRCGEWGIFGGLRGSGGFWGILGYYSDVICVAICDTHLLPGAKKKERLKSSGLHRCAERGTKESALHDVVNTNGKDRLR
eukprot:6175283-Pleurochrysis_carterae.AAC.2